MAVKPFPQRLSQAACCAVLFVFLGPGLHWTQGMRQPKQAAIEAAVVGIVCSAFAIGLAAWAIIGYRKIEAKAGLTLARGALVVGILGAVGWTVGLCVGLAR